MAQYVQIKISPSWGKVAAQHHEKMPLVVKDLLTRLGVMGSSHMKRLTPVDSGNLRKRIWYKIVGTAVHIGTNVGYAPFIITPIPPFRIVAQNAKVLAWVTKGHVRPSSPAGWKEARRRGWARYAKSVMHPGGKDILGQTNKYLGGQIPNVVRQILNKHGIV